MSQPDQFALIEYRVRIMPPVNTKLTNDLMDTALRIMKSQPDLLKAVIGGVLGSRYKELEGFTVELLDEDGYKL